MPEMPSLREMHRIVAKDPTAQALFFDLMMKLFVEHVLGVLPKGSSYGDGFVASGKPGIFGDVAAILGPIEAQARGALHPHILVWLIAALTQFKLESMRRSGELLHRLTEWSTAVTSKVASMQFDSVCEVANSIPGCDMLPPLPFSHLQKKRSLADVDVAPYEPDTNEAACGDDNKVDGIPLTGCDLSRLPVYRRKPAYERCEDGTAKMVEGELLLDSDAWAGLFTVDTRKCVIRSHIHNCRPGCFPYDHKKQKTKKLCRIGFWHIEMVEVELCDGTVVWAKCVRHGKALVTEAFVEQITCLADAGVLKLFVDTPLRAVRTLYRRYVCGAMSMCSSWIV